MHVTCTHTRTRVHTHTHTLNTLDVICTLSHIRSVLLSSGSREKVGHPGRLPNNRHFILTLWRLEGRDPGARRSGSGHTCFLADRRPSPHLLVTVRTPVPLRGPCYLLMLSHLGLGFQHRNLGVTSVPSTP